MSNPDPLDTVFVALYIHILNMYVLLVFIADLEQDHFPWQLLTAVSNGYFQGKPMKH